jgi:hypothetical protein
MLVKHERCGVIETDRIHVQCPCGCGIYLVVLVIFD